MDARSGVTPQDDCEHLPPAHIDVAVGGLARLIDTAVRVGLGGHRLTPVSYTHLTLPTNREV